MESQYLTATRKLVDSDREQALLEEMIETAKPPQSRPLRVHYLLFTPFRYPPLRYGSRFGGRHERGIWYGADAERTAFAEVAYYRLLFLEGSAADLAPLSLELSAFQASVQTDRGVDLSRAPFAAFEASVSSPTRYDESQALGTAMREAGVVAFRYVSARDRERGTCVALFSPKGFSSPRPSLPQAWHCVAARDAVEVTKKDFFERVSFAFPRSDFLVSGALPRPAL